MEKITISKFDPLDFLKNEHDYNDALRAAFEEDPGDGSLIAKTIGLVAKAKGMSKVSNETGLARESLYKALSGEGNPEFRTICKVFKALGFNLTFTQATHT